jgi:hypothetical protein
VLLDLRHLHPDGRVRIAKLRRASGHAESMTIIGQQCKRWPQRYRILP